MSTLIAGARRRASERKETSPSNKMVKKSALSARPKIKIPAEMDADSRRRILELYDTHPHLTQQDMQAACRWSFNVSMYYQISRALKDVGVVIYDDDGVPNVNPLVNELRKFEMALYRLEAALCLQVRTRREYVSDSEQKEGVDPPGDEGDKVRTLRARVA